MRILSIVAIAMLFSACSSTEPANRTVDHGYVRLLFDINAQGLLENIRVIESVPEGVFDKAAKRALVKWQYKAKVVDGVAVMQRDLTVQLDFDLEQ